jgi:hypothetical protein
MQNLFKNKKFENAIKWIGGAVLAKVVDVFLGFNLITISNLFGMLNFVLKVLRYPIPFGILFVLLLILVGLYLLIQRWVKNKKDNNRPVFLEYTQDSFKGTLYKWEYVYLDKQYRIGRIANYCPTCIALIVGNQCVQCTAVFWDIKDREEIIAMIRYNIEHKFKINEFEAIGE